MSNLLFDQKHVLNATISGFGNNKTILGYLCNSFSVTCYYETMLYPDGVLFDKSQNSFR